MLFNSFHFLFLFLPLTMLGYHLLGRLGARAVIAWLALMSVVFYGVWNRFFVLFLLGSILVNYLVALWISALPVDDRQRKAILALGVALNLLALFRFKYLYKAALLLNGLHLGTLHPHPVLLPLGISFFTFTQISYLVDLAEGQAERQDLLSYLLFVTFFPHLIAGPILHHKEMMPQFATGRLAGRQWLRAAALCIERGGCVGGLHMVPHGTSEEGADRRQVRAHGRRSLRPHGLTFCGERLGRPDRVLHAALLRFFGLLGHGNRTGPHLLHPVSS